jgi:type II secretory ATPase GspE/PulE/Tfp pilus assembly ATPase PilB-like protein
MKTLSVWKRLVQGELRSPEEAITHLIDDKGWVRVDQLDPQLDDRFFLQLGDIPELSDLPLVPLLLWQGYFHIGSPKHIADNELQKIADRTHTRTICHKITPESYRVWYRHRHAIAMKDIQATPTIDPLTGQAEQVDIREMMELYLSQAGNQSHRINTLLALALQHRASDIHLEPTQSGLRVRYRIDGMLRDIKVLPLEVSRPIIVALKVMSDMDIADSRRPQDGRIGKAYASEVHVQSNLDLRVSTLPCVGGEKAVIRLLPRENPFSNHMESLGFSPRALNVYQGWLHQPQGLIIMTGPTGSGKTSTLYTSLQEIATEHVNVVTIEDPVEYVLPSITQTQVNELAGMTFAAGLRAILRQDPDIVMVGEVRDPETAETVVRAALTGHLVLSTMHTNDAVSAIPRLKDLGPDPGIISDALLGVVAQRLVRKVCPHCAEPHRPDEQELRSLRLDAARMNFDRWRKGRGCERCFQSGYLGREAVVELIDINDTFRTLIYEGTITQLNHYLNENGSGFFSFRQAALEKVINGITTLEEINRVIPRSALLRKQNR